MDAVEDLDGAGLRRRAARRAGAEDVGQERPARVGLDRRADADEAAALLEVRLEVRALRVGQRARDARVQEHDRAVGVEVRGRELRADVGRRGRGDGEVAARGTRLDRRDTRRRQCVLRAGDDQHLGRGRRSGLGPRRRRRRQHEGQAQQSQACASPPHCTPLDKRVTLCAARSARTTPTHPASIRGPGGPHSSLMGSQ